MTYAILFAIGFGIGFYFAYQDTTERSSKLDAYEKRINIQHQAAVNAESSAATLNQHTQRLLKDVREFGASLSASMLKGRQWLADGIAEYVELRDLSIETWLAVKPHPAWTASQAVRAVRAKHRESVRLLKMMEFQLASYEEYFPALSEYREAILDEAVDLRSSASEALEKADPALSLGYLNKDEYDRLSTVEKYQLALDRYWGRPKGTFGIGKLYERFWGSRYESAGWKVTFHGIIKGCEDFGRDLICERGSDVHIVQCKCWAKDKLIREKHIFQLFGTTVLFRIQNSGRNVFPIFASTIDLSPDATMVANALGISVQKEPLRRFPMIKCNINPQTKERIYHLPFDQQYDRVMIGHVEGECYVDTVAEAEKLGFRRAWRWQGNS